MMLSMETTMTTRQTSTQAMGAHRRAGTHARWLAAIAVFSLATPAQAAGPLPPQPLPPTGPILPPGLYVQVLDGLINVTNPSGASNFSAGQFGFVPSFHQPPVVVPFNPGIQFTPPPTFSSGTPLNKPSSSAPAKAVDCEVR
jgi:hypothetical protein